MTEPLSVVHDIVAEGADRTLCGLTADDYPTLGIGCDCGHPECQHKVTCPTCLAVRESKVAVQ